MAQLIIQGGHVVSGTFRPAGNKNAALPMLAASLLTEDPVVLRNLPLIQDVRVMMDLLSELGVEVELDGHTATLRAASIRSRSLNGELCGKIRGSIVLAGPLAARHGEADMTVPGGDVIGRRRLDTHIEGLRALGIDVELDVPRAALRLRRGRLAGADLLLDEASVTATENILMAAVLAPGRTVLYHVACEPHVQDLCRLLNAMGARIEGIGANRLVIDGVESLHGADVEISSDYTEVGSFLAAAAATGGGLTVPVTGSTAPYRVIERTFQRLGVQWSVDGRTLTLPAGQELSVRPDLGGAIPKIEDGIWPSFPSDLMSVALILATQADGHALFFEKLFESRLYFVDRLLDMGARIVQCDPHRVMVCGPSRLRGRLLTSPDIRAGAAMVIAALCASGETVLHNADMIDRGYERIDERLRALGAVVERRAADGP
jgi:UDP-N-acetylglucosamine 1-carboxyvinyltransferase